MARADTEVAPQQRRVQAQKLSYKDQRELDALPGKIESLESEQSELQAMVSAAGFYRQPEAAIADTLARLEVLGTELENCYGRWEELESGPAE